MNNKSSDNNSKHQDLAANAIRGKLKHLYDKEPSALDELAESEVASRPSKHQLFIRNLHDSGQNLASIQTAWHDYYQNLPEHEKHEVWDEFYDSQKYLKHPASSSHSSHNQRTLKDTKKPRTLKEKVNNHVSAGGKLKAKHHLQSLLFGLGMGFVVLLVLLFGFFNEVVIAPFVQPSRANANAPLIVSSDSITPSAQPEIIIPKINVQIPVNYGVKTIDESAVENSLESGVVHYPTTSVPGQKGNSAFFGHSSNNIFNKGKYKFAFVLLRTLENDDTFYLTYNGKIYVYKVISKKVVDPSEVGVLGNVEGQTATATLITCDPPGTSLKRMVVVGTQVSPDPATNSATSNDSSIASYGSSQLPGNGPTLFNNFIGTTLGKLIVASILVVLMIIGIRWLQKPTKRSY